MNPTDFLYGCRSGIQKAIRRGDLPLAKLCFDSLWANKVHRAWLNWRIPILVMEESFYFIGELVEFINSGQKDEKSWRKFLYQLVICQKSKDSSSIYQLIKLGVENLHPEVILFKKYFKNNTGDSIKIFNSFVDDHLKDRSLNLYEINSIKFLLKRASLGGRLVDRYLCTIVAGLVMNRGLNQDEVKSFISKQIDLILKKKFINLEENITLPWFVFDKHTILGGMALSILSKKIGDWNISNEELWRIWFILESNYVPIDNMIYSQVKENPSSFESMWTVHAIKEGLNGINNKSAKEVSSFWRITIRPEVQSVVEFLMKRRA